MICSWKYKNTEIAKVELPMDILKQPLQECQERLTNQLKMTPLILLDTAIFHPKYTFFL